MANPPINVFESGLTIYNSVGMLYTRVIAAPDIVSAPSIDVLRIRNMYYMQRYSSAWKYNFFPTHKVILLIIFIVRLNCQFSLFARCVCLACAILG